MASKKQLIDSLRAEQVARIMALLADEDVQQIASNVFAFPCTDSDSNDQWVKVTVTIPTGSRDGDIFDGYSEAQAYSEHCAEMTAKKEKAEAEKSAKKAKDEAERKAKAEAKARHEAEKAGS